MLSSLQVATQACGLLCPLVFVAAERYASRIRAQLFGCAIQERSRIEYLHNREIAAEYMELAQNSASLERRMVYLKMANGLALNGAPLVHRWRSVAVLVDGRD